MGYQEGSIISKIILQTKEHSLTLFSLAKGQEIATHVTSGQALVQVIDGEARIVIDNKPHIVKKGESILMPVNIPHSVHADCNFKMLLSIYY